MYVCIYVCIAWKVRSVNDRQNEITVTYVFVYVSVCIERRASLSCRFSLRLALCFGAMYMLLFFLSWSLPSTRQVGDKYVSTFVLVLLKFDWFLDEDQRSAATVFVGVSSYARAYIKIACGSEWTKVRVGSKWLVASGMWHVAYGICNVFVLMWKCECENVKPL